MLKKLSVLIVVGILVGCTNIDNLGGKKDSGPIREIGGEPQIPGETKIFTFYFSSSTYETYTFGTSI